MHSIHVYQKNKLKYTLYRWNWEYIPCTPCQLYLMPDPLRNKIRQDHFEVPTITPSWHTKQHIRASSSWFQSENSFRPKRVECPALAESSLAASENLATDLNILNRLASSTSSCLYVLPCSFIQSLNLALMAWSSSMYSRTTVFSSGVVSL